MNIERTKTYLVMTLLSLGLFGCTGLSLNEGSVDYRLIPAESGDAIQANQYVVNEAQLRRNIGNAIGAVKRDLAVVSRLNAKELAEFKNSVRAIEAALPTKWTKKAVDDLSAHIDRLDTKLSDGDLKANLASLKKEVTVKPINKIRKDQILASQKTIKNNQELDAIKSMSRLSFQEVSALKGLLGNERFSAGLGEDLIEKCCYNGKCPVDQLNLALVLPFRITSLSTANQNWLKHKLDRQFQSELSVAADYSPDEELSIRYFPSSDSISFINEGESLTISLLQAFICDFKETGLWDWGIPLYEGSLHNPCKSDDKTSGEILISANVMEKKKGNGVTFNYSDIKKGKGRVVFYSEDVMEYGQYLNFSNMPIYGPISYTGKPVFLEFNILELDTAEGSQSRNLLASLADLGGSAYPPASPVLAILNTLGDSVLSSTRDDLEFRYQMELVPRTDKQSPGISRPFLREGIYVFIRSEDRSRPIPWSEVSYDEKTGRLRKKIETDSTSWEDYRDQTYLVVQISKGDSTTDLDTAQLVSQFLEVEETSKAYSVAMIESLGNAASALKNRDKLKRIKDAVQDISRSLANPDKPVEIAPETYEIAFGGLCDVVLKKALVSHDDFEKLLKQLGKDSSPIVNKVGLTTDQITTACDGASGAADATGKLKDLFWPSEQGG